MIKYSCGILTISDKGSAGKRRDTSGPALKIMLAENNFSVEAYEIVPDERETIEITLMEWADKRNIDVVITTGGTGVSPRDVTPEATRAVIDYEIPGMSEAMRSKSLSITPYAVLSRGICGVRNKTLIINLPGSESGAGENLSVILPVIEHAVYKIKGGNKDCSMFVTPEDDS